MAKKVAAYRSTERNMFCFLIPIVEIVSTMRVGKQNYAIVKNIETGIVFTVKRKTLTVHDPPLTVLENRLSKMAFSLHKDLFENIFTIILDGREYIFKGNRQDVKKQINSLLKKGCYQQKLFCDG